MRQKLINKLPDLEDDTNLADLIFNPQLSSGQWYYSLKSNSRKLSNYLMNNNLQGVNSYLKKSGKKLDFLQKENQAISQKQDVLISYPGIYSLNYKDLLSQLLQTAILIEHSTIPPYLTALYSIKEGSNSRVSQVIRSVAVEEMLHMILVCNVMNALAIQPVVNKPENYPAYPAKLPLNLDFKLNLDKFSKSTIQTFITIESPSNSMVDAPFDEIQLDIIQEDSFKVTSENYVGWEGKNILKLIEKQIDTIGEFYDITLFLIVVFQVIDYYKRTGIWPSTIDEINKGGIFNGDPGKQIQPEEYYGSGGTLSVVESLEDVFKVFEEIKGQGEGGDGTLFTTDPSQFEEGFELAHYFRFKEIFHEHTYLGGNYDPFCDENGMMPIITPPVGRALKVDWDAVYPIKPNIKIADVKDNTALYHQMNQFNISYKNMLDAIQDAIEGNKENLSKSILIMYKLKEQAVDIMRQNIDGNTNAAPSFEYPIL